MIKNFSNTCYREYCFPTIIFVNHRWPSMNLMFNLFLKPMISINYFYWFSVNKITHISFNTANVIFASISAQKVSKTL